MDARKRSLSQMQKKTQASELQFQEKADSDCETKTPASKRKVQDRSSRNESGKNKSTSAPRRTPAARCKESERAKDSDSSLEEDSDSIMTSIGGGSGGLHRRSKLAPGPSAPDPPPDCASVANRLARSLHGRREQVGLLTSLLDEPGCPGYPLLFVHGNSGMGKSLVVSAVVDALEVPHALVDCREHFTTRSLLETAMDQLNGHSLSAACSYASRHVVENAAVFVKKLTAFVRSDEMAGKTACIIVDGADKLRSLDCGLLAALTRLHELCHDNRICVVLISCLTWEAVRGFDNCFDPISIHFPNYSKEETASILTLHRPGGSPASFYSGFVSQLWSVLGHVSRDINELRHLADMLYPKYRAPVDSGEVSSNDSRKLWSRIQPTLKAFMSKIYLHEFEVVPKSGAGSLEEAERGTGTPSSREVMELSHYGKFLLLSAYLASYNPATTDKRFFAKGKASGRKSKKTSRRAEKLSRQLIGPKSFPLDRMMAIFHSIIDGKVDPFASLFTQISSLVQLQFLTQVAMGDSYLDSPKYKCLVTLDFVLGVARSVDCDLLSYLHDFI